MAAPTKLGTKWIHRVQVNGKRTSGTFDTKAAALAWEAEQRVATPKGKLGLTKTCADAFEKYELEVSKQKRGYRWEALRLAAMAETDLGKVKMVDLDSTHIAAWRDQRLKQVAPGSVTREMNLLSNVFSVARKEWKWISTSPTADVKRPKAPPARNRLVSQKEIETMCIALGWRHDIVDVAPTTKQQRIALAFLFAIETAMRAGEICSLREDDVQGRVARLHMTKNGLPRDVPLSARALEIWGMVPEGFGVTAATLDAMFRVARKRAGITDMTFHDTRHEAITRLAKKLHVLDLARMVGHSDIRQLQTYYNETAADIAAKL
ncbi:tyrosine-type recombinase/integrase [Duganella sp. CT11-25]|uniref:tyrosine-type recombinase/integrase n=1 Tax=unclassified Duganella TaxID=2636909 RepID=UPI0039AEBB51